MESLDLPFLDKSKESVNQKASILFTGYLLGCSMLQAVTLFFYSGVVFGVIFIVLFSLANYKFTCIIIESCRFTQEYSYIGFLEVMFGSTVKNWFLVTFILISLCQVSIFQEIQLCNIKYFLENVLELDENIDFIAISILVLISIPMIFLVTNDDVNKIWYFGLIGIIFSIFAGFLFLFTLLQNWENFRISYIRLFSSFVIDDSSEHLSTGLVYGVYMMEAYAPIPCIFRGNSTCNIKKSFILGYIYTLCIYIIVGLLGYAAFVSLQGDSITSAELSPFIILEKNYFEFIDNKTLLALTYILYIFYFAAEIILYLQPAWLFFMQLFYGKDFSESQLKYKIIIGVFLILTIYFGKFKLMPENFLSFLSESFFVAIIILCIICQIYVTTRFRDRVLLFAITIGILPVSIYGSFQILKS